MSTKDLYEQAGFSLSEIARMTGIPKSTLHGRLQAYGVKFRPRGGGKARCLPHDEFARTVLLRRLGMTQRAIGRELGVNHSTVQYRLRRAGVK